MLQLYNRVKNIDKCFRRKSNSFSLFYIYRYKGMCEPETKKKLLFSAFFLLYIHYPTIFPHALFFFYTYYILFLHFILTILYFVHYSAEMYNKLLM